MADVVMLQTLSLHQAATYGEIFVLHDIMVMTLQGTLSIRCTVPLLAPSHKHLMRVGEELTARRLGCNRENPSEVIPDGAWNIRSGNCRYKETGEDPIYTVESGLV